MDETRIPPYTILIPAFNEAGVLGKVLGDLGKPQQCQEIIVVDDGSEDETQKVAENAGARVIRHPVNRGYGAALKTGIAAVTTDYTICFDADGQHRLEDLISIADVMSQFDMVVGARDKQSKQPLMRLPGKKVLSLVVNYLSERKIPDINSGLRAFKTSIVKKHLNLFPDGWSFTTTSTVAFHRMKYLVHYLRIMTHPRQGGLSRVNIISDGISTLMLIINMTVLFRPLQVFIPAAFFLMFSSLIYFIIYCVTVRIHITPSMVMLFLTGVLIFFMGILCEQISSIRRNIHSIQRES